jgi:hypothetical protein
MKIKFLNTSGDIKYAPEAEGWIKGIILDEGIEGVQDAWDGDNKFDCNLWKEDEGYFECALYPVCIDKYGNSFTDTMNPLFSAIVDVEK